MMASCPRPRHLPRRSVLLSVSRCCSRSWRSWPVSATPSTGASWRSWPRSIATSCGAATGARSVAALVAWKMGASSANATAIATVAHRSEAFPRCVAELREGRLSLDQVGVIAARAADGSDEHYAQLARVATVNQLRTAVKLEPRPDPAPRPDPQASITKTGDEQFTSWRITLPHLRTRRILDNTNSAKLFGSAQDLLSRATARNSALSCRNCRLTFRRVGRPLNGSNPQSPRSCRSSAVPENN